MEKRKVLSVALPRELYSDVLKMGKKRRMAQSEVVREALREYIEERRWRELCRYGELQSARRGLVQEDVEGLVDALRK